MGLCAKCCGYGDRFSLNDDYPHAGWTYDDFYSTVVAARPVNVGGEFIFQDAAIEIFDIDFGADADIHASVRIKLEEFTAGDGVDGGIIVGWTSSDNFLFVKLVKYPAQTDDCSFLEFWAKDLGIPGGIIYMIDRIPIPLTLSIFHELHVCLIHNNYYTYNGTTTGDTLRAYVKLTDQAEGEEYYGWEVYAIGTNRTGFNSGPKAGLIQTNQNATNGVVTYDDWRVTPFRDEGVNKCCANCNTPCPIYRDTLQHGDIAQAATMEPGESWYRLTCFFGVISGPDMARFADGGIVEYLEIDTDGVVKCLLPHHTNKTSIIVEVDLLWEENGVAFIALGNGYVVFDEVQRLILLWDSDDNLLDTVTSLPAFDNEFHAVTLCYNEGALSASFDGADFCISGGSNTEVADAFVYLGSKNNTVRFQHLVMDKHRNLEEPRDGGCPDCPNCPVTCNACQSSSASGLMKAVLPADLIDSATPCATIGFTNCLDATGTSILTHGILSQTSCAWGITLPSNQYIVVYAEKPGDIPIEGGASLTTYRLAVTLRCIQGIVPSVIWVKDYGAVPPNCLELFDEEIPWLENSAGTIAEPGCHSSTNLPAYLSSM